MTPDSTSSARDGDVAALDVHIRVVDIDLAGGFSTVIRIINMPTYDYASERTAPTRNVF